MDKIDAYAKFFELLPKNHFFDFGLNNIITIKKDIVEVEWLKLKNKIANKSNELFVRNSGRNGTGNKALALLYKEVFGIDINFDLTNNNKPTQLIMNSTGYRKNKTIFNYQVSHVFGNTKNVFCFTAPWNIVLIPKIVDPFTGHEAVGDYVIEFRQLFRNRIFKSYSDYILDYNELMNQWSPKVFKWIEENISDKDRNKYMKEFQCINY